MISEVLVVGGLNKRADHSEPEYNRVLGHIWDIVSKPEGFQSIRTFKADDGETVTIWGLPLKRHRMPGVPIQSM